jgi:methanogenic corrinoid protein MtbC1
MHRSRCSVLLHRVGRIAATVRMAPRRLGAGLRVEPLVEPGDDGVVNVHAMSLQAPPLNQPRRTRSAAPLLDSVPPTELAMLRADTGVLPPEAQVGHLVRTLEREVIPRLAQAHRPAGSDAEPPPDVLTAADVQEFAARLIDAADVAVAESIEQLRSRGIAVEALYLDLFAPTACHFGRLWDNDECDFTTVTAVVGRLQRLLRDMSAAFGPATRYPTHGRRVLLAQPPQEQHSLGLSMVAEFFRRDGWLVEGGVGAAARDPVARVRAEWFDVIGFSVGSTPRLEWLRDRIAALRLASRNAAVVVLVGGPVFAAEPAWAQQVGADGCAADARGAPELAAQRVGASLART